MHAEAMPLEHLKGASHLLGRFNFVLTDWLCLAANRLFQDWLCLEANRLFRLLNLVHSIYIPKPKHLQSSVVV